MPGSSLSSRSGATHRAVAVTLALVAVLGGARLPAAAGDGGVWITVGEEVFASAAAKLAPLPGLGGGVVLERFDEHDGVVLTRIPAGNLEALGRIVHDEFNTCGGFVKHESLREAREAMARLRAPRPGLLALPFTIDQPALVASLAGEVSEANLLSTITSLSTQFVNRYHAHPTGHQAATWIKDLWTSYAAGRPDVTVALFDHGSITPQPSVILTIPGSTLPDEVVVLGGHLDSTRSGCSFNPDCVAPGADDDASGIAVLSEAIRIALVNGFQPQRTIQFMAYAAEEVGLDGSDDIASTYFAQGVDVVAVLQQDMTAYDGSTQDIFLYTSHTDPELNAFFGDLIETYQPGLVWTTSACPYACSDHASWWSRGYRASFAFEAAYGQHNPQIHTGNDTVATFGNSAAHAAKFARLAVAFMVEAGVDGDPAGTLEFSAPFFAVAEGDGTAIITVMRSGGSGGAASVDCRTVAGGTAVAGLDYLATDMTLSWGAGQSGTRDCTVSILDDTLDEGVETVELALDNATGATLGTQVTTTLMITDDDEGGVLEFAAATSEHDESVGTATVTVNRTEGSASGVTVSYSATGGTATGGGVDYTLTAGTLSFGAGVSSRSFDVEIVDDGSFEPDETIEIEISAPTGGATLGATTQHTLTILDDDFDPVIFADGFETGDTSRWSSAIP